jgi:hypothetical protein
MQRQKPVCARATREGAGGALFEGTLGTWYSEQRELAEAATSPHARNRSDSRIQLGVSVQASTCYLAAV